MDIARTPPRIEDITRLPGTPPRPGPGAVDLWIASLDDNPDVFLPTLSEAERERGAAFHFEKDRRKYAVGRGLLRRVLGHYLDCDPAGIRIVPDDRGKPRLDDPKVTDLDFNLSHSGERVLFAITGGIPVGVDLEAISRETNLPECARTICSAEELPRFRALPAAELPRALLRLWTAKEAFLKAIGTGLHVAPDRLEIPDSIREGSSTAAAIRWLDSPEISARHVVHPLPHCETLHGYSAAVVLLDGKVTLPV